MQPELRLDRQCLAWPGAGRALAPALADFAGQCHTAVADETLGT